MHIPACEKRCTEIITLKNRYARRSKLSEKALLGLVCLFAMDLDAAAIAATLGISRNTVNSYVHKLRLRMAEDALAVLPQSEGLGAGEAYFQLSPLWRNKILPPMLFGVINNQERIYIELQPGAAKTVLQMFQRGRFHMFGSVRLEQWEDFRATLDLEYGAPPQGGDRGSHPAGGQARNLVYEFFLHTHSRLSKFRGLREESVRLFLKESAFRFNAKGITTFTALKQLLRAAPLE